MRVMYFDYPSLPAAVAVIRAHLALGRHAGLASSAAQPLMFGGFDTLGLEMTVPLTLDQQEEIGRWSTTAAQVGLEVTTPRSRPPTTPAHVIGDLADELGLGRDWRQAVIVAYWSDRVDIGHKSELVRLANHVGLPEQEVASALTDRHRAQQVRRRMVAARQRGIGGVPVIEIDGTLLSGDLSDDAWDTMIRSW